MGASSNNWDDMPDDMLVMHAKTGDEDAFRVLFLRYKSETYRCLVQVVGNDELVKDLWQDTCVKAWIHIQKLNEPSKFKSWLLTTAKRLALDKLKKDHRERIDSLDGIGGTSDPIDCGADPTVVIETDYVQHILEKMEPVLRDVLRLSAFGYSRVEIAHQLGYKESTVTTYQSKAREQFRQLYHVMGKIDDSSNKEKNDTETHKPSQQESLNEKDHSQQSHYPDETRKEK